MKKKFFALLSLIVVLYGCTTENFNAKLKDVSNENSPKSNGGPSIYSPLIKTGTVYVGSNDNRLYAFDELTGAQKWVANINGPIFSSPTVAFGQVYVSSDYGYVYAFD